MNSTEIGLQNAASLAKEPLIEPSKGFADVTNEVCAPLEMLPGKLWLKAFGAANIVLVFGLFCMGLTVATGIGQWNLNRTVGWAFDITNFVFWIGIGHAGTLISAILFLFRQKWRTSINRSAEAMTIFAVMTAGLFPLLHVGRQWLAFWLFPYPNSRQLWVNFRSPLLWDVFAVSTYFTISLVFWYIGLIPDIASVRDRAKNKVRRGIYGALSLGWTGSARAWNHYETAYMLLAGLSTPLVLSVHSIVSFDFAVSLLPGWHTTIFPPYFVAGAVFSGFAMVLTLLIIAREVLPQLKNYIRLVHLENMNKIILLTSLLVGYAYLSEFFVAWYSGSMWEKFHFWNRMFGPMWWSAFFMYGCNMIVPQFFWSKRIRRSIPAMFVISLLVNVGMWFERFTIIVSSLYRDFLPSSWSMYKPSWVELGILFGSFGLFFTLFLAFCRILPMIAMAEVKGVIHGAKHEGKH